MTQRYGLGEGKGQVKKNKTKNTDAPSLQICKDSSESIRLVKLDVSIRIFVRTRTYERITFFIANYGPYSTGNSNTNST